MVARNMPGKVKKRREKERNQIALIIQMIVWNLKKFSM